MTLLPDLALCFWGLVLQPFPSYAVLSPTAGEHQREDGGDLLWGKGTRWQWVPCFGKDMIPNSSKMAAEPKGKVGAMGCRAGSVLGSNF